MKTILMILVFFLAFRCFAQDYEFKRDFFDEGKINITTNGTKAGYFKKDFNNENRIILYDGMGQTVGYYQADFYDPNKIVFHSSHTYNNYTNYPCFQRNIPEFKNPIHIPHADNLFNTEPVKVNPQGNDNFIKNLQAIKDAKEGKSKKYEDKPSEDGKHIYRYRLDGTLIGIFTQNDQGGYTYFPLEKK